MIKYLRTFGLLFLVLGLAVSQISLVNSLPYGFNQINLVLVLLIIFLFFFDFSQVVGWGLVLGFFLDIFIFDIFGSHLVTIFLTLLVCDLLLVNWFTNRSAYSFLALTFFATIFYNLSLYTLIYLNNFLSDRGLFLFTGNFWLGLLWQLGWNLLFILIFFIITSLTTNRLKPVFLDKK